MNEMYKTDRDRRDLLIGAYHEHGLSNQEIAKITHLSSAEVSRALARLRETGALTTNIHLNYGDNRMEVMANMRSTQFEKYLRNAFRWGVSQTDLSEHNNIWVVPGNMDDKIELDKHFALKLTARFAAEKLLRYLEMKKDAKIGISWGHTLYWFTEELERILSRKQPNREKFPDVTVFNIAGDMHLDMKKVESNNKNKDPSIMPLLYEASTLASRLAQTLATKNLFLCHLPGWIPLDPDITTESALKKCHQKTLDIFKRYREYRQIFGSADKPGLITEADVLITGIGSKHNLYKLLEMTGRLYDKDGKLYTLAEKIFARTSVSGDMSGVFLAKKGYQQEMALSDFSIGVTFRDFKYAWNEANAKGSDRLGILAVAAGNTKAEALKVALDSFLINELVIDKSLCNATLKLVKAEQQGERMVSG